MLSTLFSNDVRQTLDQFRRSVDQVLTTSTVRRCRPVRTRAGSGPGRSVQLWSPAGTTSSSACGLLCQGVAENDVQVTVQNNQLVIEGERRAPEGFDKNAWTQLPYGKFYTGLTLPAGLDVDHVSCRLYNGILEIRLPILEASKPKQIQIQTGEAHKAIA